MVDSLGGKVRPALSIPVMYALWTLFCEILPGGKTIFAIGPYRVFLVEQLHLYCSFVFCCIVTRINAVLRPFKGNRVGASPRVTYSN